MLSSGWNGLSLCCLFKKFSWINDRNIMPVWLSVIYLSCCKASIKKSVPLLNCFTGIQWMSFPNFALFTSFFFCVFFLLLLFPCILYKLRTGFTRAHIRSLVLPLLCILCNHHCKHLAISMARKRDAESEAPHWLGTSTCHSPGRLQGHSSEFIFTHKLNMEIQ